MLKTPVTIYTKKLFINPKFLTIKKYGIKPPLINIGMIKKFRIAVLNNKYFLVKTYAAAEVQNKVTNVLKNVLSTVSWNDHKISPFANTTT